MPEHPDWPPLDWPQWQATATTLHMFTQIVGKTRLDLTPLQNHWWNVPLYVSVRGLTTSPMPLPDGRALEIEFDFIAHQLHFSLSTGDTHDLPLRPQSVLAFFAAYRGTLKLLNIPAHIWPMPVELQAPIRFDQDHTNASYDPEAVQRFHRILLLSVDTVLQALRHRLPRQDQSPVHFFWGSFDLCVTRFSGRLASEAQPAAPPKPTPSSRRPIRTRSQVRASGPATAAWATPAFYCYAAPVPAGPCRPNSINPGVLESKPSANSSCPMTKSAPHLIPKPRCTAFLQSSYAACAEAAHWHRAALERPLARQHLHQAVAEHTILTCATVRQSI